MSEYRLKIAFSLQRGQFGPKFQLERIAPTNHASCQITTMNDLSCGMRMCAELTFVLSQCTHLTNRQTDRKVSEIPCVGLHAVAL